MTSAKPSAPAVARLRVPVTVRLSPDATGQLDGAQMRAGVASAVEAACVRFPLSALGIRPGDITRVDVAAQSGFRVEVTQALLAAAATGATEGAARAGFRSSPRSRGRPRLSEPAAEPFDPSRVRHRSGGDTYVIPFFDGGTTEVPLRQQPGPRTQPSIPSAGVAVTIEEAVGIAWRWHLYRVGRQDFTQEFPGYYGFVRTTKGTFLCFVFLTRVDQVGPAGTPLPGRYVHEIRLDNGGLFQGVEFRHQRAGWSTIWMPSGRDEPGSFELPGGDVIPIVFAVQDALPTTPGKPGARDLGYIALPGETATPYPADFDNSLDDLESALDISEPPRSEAGTQHFIPGDPLAPTRTLLCAPYLVEPDVSKLVDTRNLSGRIRSLASVLGIPECGFAGTFALHCAQVVGAHARGVAAASIASSVTTEVTVHPDGSGNNGYVHVKATTTPELLWMRRLAGIAREVGDFAADVVSTYVDPQNSALVGIDSDDPRNSAGWVLRFDNDFPRTLRFGYEMLFAETCRAIMLQQLRSSHSGITARQESKNFESLLLDIGTKLEILGDIVLWPTVLLRTLEHSKDVYMSSGTVRDILSTQETISDPHGFSYDLPAPIDSTPERILALVGDDRMEKQGGTRVVIHDGRSWKADQLRETINQRRQLLNLSDPLFFQVADLQSIVLGREQDRGYLERYLRNLLAEMLSANVRMTNKAEDLDDGAYFALEASQYVAREGGRDWRGLRYNLQGIHALASDQLVSEVHGDRLFFLAINDAIDHKADKDAIIQIASTLGIVVLGLFCAPLGAVAAGAITAIVGIGFTIHDVLDARRQSDLYKALEDPELFQHWQDVQLAEMMAAISIAFSIFDVIAVGKAAKGLTTAAYESLRIAEKAGAKTVYRLAAQSVREQIIKGLTEEAIKRAVKQAVIEATVIKVMEVLLPKVIEPVLVPWMREQAQLHGTSAEVDAALGSLAGDLR